jgi:hypothetical protein
MAQVMARRDDNWKKLQQYVLDEGERFAVLGPAGRPIYGFQRDYTWFIRQGTFVRSPVRVDGVTLDDAARRRYEAEWIADEKRRAAGRPAAKAGGETRGAGPAGLVGGAEPRFVHAAYFLKFKFEPGRYALVGRERIAGVDALRIEYYPQRLFHEGRARPNKRLRERDDEVEAKMNKASLVTLWVAPATHQILQFTFDNVDWDFLPGRSFARIDSLVASMRMTEAFPSVWLPHDVTGRFRLTTAMGSFEAQYDVRYHDYREASVTVKVK